MHSNIDVHPVKVHFFIIISEPILPVRVSTGASFNNYSNRYHIITVLILIA